MPNFFYTAKSAQGEEKSGTQEADSKKELAHILRQKGFILTSARILGQKSKGLKIDLRFLTGFLQKISLVDKIMFARHLSVMIKAGLSLNQSLETLIKQIKKPYFVKIIETLNQDIQKGLSFGDALAKHPQVFSKLFISMIRVGETAGNLEEVLTLLADQMDKDHQLLTKLKGALVYPAVILIAMVGIAFLMMTIVVPKLSSIFEELEIELPLTTKIIIKISQLFEAHAVLFLSGLVMIGFLIKRSFQNRKIQRAFDWMTLRLPIINNIIKKINSARFARTFSSLIEGGIPFSEALQITSETLTNSYYTQSLINSIPEVQRGSTLSNILNHYPLLYPPLITEMIAVGEKTGALTNVLKELAGFYEEEVTVLSKSLATVIEPVLMIVIGAAVGFFAISMIQPMYSMLGGI